jgi:hypothetical protein
MAVSVYPHRRGDVGVSSKRVVLVVVAVVAFSANHKDNHFQRDQLLHREWEQRRQPLFLRHPIFLPPRQAETVQQPLQKRPSFPKDHVCAMSHLRHHRLVLNNCSSDHNNCSSKHHSLAVPATGDNPWRMNCLATSCHLWITTIVRLPKP